MVPLYGARAKMPDWRLVNFLRGIWMSVSAEGEGGAWMLSEDEEEELEIEAEMGREEEERERERRIASLLLASIIVW